MAFTWGQFSIKCSRYPSLIWTLLIYDDSHISQGPMRLVSALSRKPYVRNNHSDNHTKHFIISVYCILQIFKCFCINKLQFGKPVCLRSVAGSLSSYLITIAFSCNPMFLLSEFLPFSWMQKRILGRQLHQHLSSGKRSFHRAIGVLIWYVLVFRHHGANSLEADNPGHLSNHIGGMVVPCRI